MTKRFFTKFGGELHVKVQLNRGTQTAAGSISVITQENKRADWW